MSEQQKNTSDEIESGLNTGADIAGRAVQKGLPSRPNRGGASPRSKPGNNQQPRNPSDGQGNNSPGSNAGPPGSGANNPHPGSPNSNPDSPGSNTPDASPPGGGGDNTAPVSPDIGTPQAPDSGANAPGSLGNDNGPATQRSGENEPGAKSGGAEDAQDPSGNSDSTGGGNSGSDAPGIGGGTGDSLGAGGTEGGAAAGSGGAGSSAGTGAASGAGSGAGSAAAGSGAAGGAAGGAAASGGAAAGGAAAGGAASGAAAGATVGSAAGPVGTAVGAVAGALIVPFLKFVGMAIATVFVFISFFMMQPSFLYDNSGATNDRKLLEDSYNTYYRHMEEEYGSDISSAMNDARTQAWWLFQAPGELANNGDTSLLFSAPAPYPYVSMSEEDKASIQAILDDDSDYDEYEFYYGVEYLHDYETYLESASSNINLVMSMIDVQKKHWFISLFDTVADAITGGHYSRFTDWVGRKWDGFWNDFIIHDLFSISYGGYTLETEYVDEDEIIVAKIKIVYMFDLKDLGVGFYADKLNLDQDQIDRATEMSHYLGDLFGSTSEIYFGWYVQGGYYTDAIQGGYVAVNINNALTEFADIVDGMEYDPGGSHTFPLQGYSEPNMSSAYGPRNFPQDPWHTGIDFAAPTGTPVVSVADGVVLFIAQMPKGFGNYIVVYHGMYNGAPVSTMYAHMSAFGTYRAGDSVSRGDVLGYVGNTGLSTGPHLHFQLHVGDSVRNPVEFFEFLEYLRP